MNTITSTPALSGSPSVLFVALWILEALAATRRSCTTLWHHLAYAVTPEWLHRHYALISTLKAAGVTHQYDYHEVERFKRHIVETRSDPLWREARRYWLVTRKAITVARRVLIAATVVMAIVFVVLCIATVCLVGVWVLREPTLAMAWEVLSCVACMLASAGSTYGLYRLVDHIECQEFKMDQRFRTNTSYRNWVYWRTVPFWKHQDRVPEHVSRVEDATRQAGGYVSVDEAKKGSVYVDPFLYVSAVPMWISAIPGLRRLRRCVAQWGDDEFEDGGFADRAKRPL
jgi:hypothetical protein